MRNLVIALGIGFLASCSGSSYVDRMDTESLNHEFDFHVQNDSSYPIKSIHIRPYIGKPLHQTPLGDNLISELVLPDQNFVTTLTTGCYVMTINMIVPRGGDQPDRRNTYFCVDDVEQLLLNDNSFSFILTNFFDN